MAPPAPASCSTTPGHIITNNHVVEQAAEDDGPIEVVDQDGNRYDATVVGRSPVYDLAVLYVDEAKDLQAGRARRVAGPARRRPGRRHRLAAGPDLHRHRRHRQRPAAPGHHRRLGRASRRTSTPSRPTPRSTRATPAVRWSTCVGQVVGVNSAIATTGGTTGGDQAGNIGVGFAIPIEQVKVTADQILRTGEARYPVIGAKVQTGQRDGSGAEIDEVIDDTPAEDAGLEKGDVVVALEGQRVTDGIALIVSIRTHQPGETLTFTVAPRRRRAGPRRHPRPEVG